MVVRGSPWLQAWCVARLQSGCGGLTSVSTKGIDETGGRNVSPAISKGTLELSSLGALL